MELSSNERFAKDLRAVASIVSLALVSSAFILGCCILGASEVSPGFGGVPIIGIIGLGFSLVSVVYIFIKGRPYLK
ncbi:hypothetical protein Shel_18000 [Slackia heliotrinireducens DSM 20476]|uniref:Uncharacterized protein n=1 Tax=Slackia heliotrinireducens (strain ATCC 29202 / DSM 20476 / NCTC 11029 / RHS 1) TaxID=471855 RepID=C7N7D4_SLAHD|nr:hypothetical protein Shel_18000 [Slackia heliotrinireducens DSM 20476]